MPFGGVPAAFFVENLFPKHVKLERLCDTEVKGHIGPGQGQKTYVLPDPLRRCI